MNSESVEQRRTLGWLIVAAAAVRTAFGIVMAIGDMKIDAAGLLSVTQ